MKLTGRDSGLRAGRVIDTIVFVCRGYVCVIQVEVVEVVIVMV